MNIDQMKKILADAPDGATHCTDTVPSMNLYAKVEHLGGFYVSLSNRWEPYPIYAGIHLLSDLRTIINQHEEIENLKGHILVLQRRIEALRERQNVIKPENVEYYPHAMSDAEIVELSKLDKEKTNERD